MSLDSSKRPTLLFAMASLPKRFPWLPPSTGAPVLLGDQFAAFADELREWAEMELESGLESWPNDDWSDL